MRDIVYLLIFDGFADWQVALALCEIRRPGDWEVQTVGFSMAPVQSMGGLMVHPERSLERIDPARAALLLVPGGHLWQRGEGESAVTMVRQLHEAGAVVAGIDSAVLLLARAGLLDRVRHTGNGPGEIGDQVADYTGTDRYEAGLLAASDGGVISAGYLGSVELAREVIRTLDLYSPSDREHWYRLFSHAPPASRCVAVSAVAA